MSMLTWKSGTERKLMFKSIYIYIYLQEVGGNSQQEQEENGRDASNYEPT